MYVLANGVNEQQKFIIYTQLAPENIELCTDKINIKVSLFYPGSCIH